MYEVDDGIERGPTTRVLHKRQNHKKQVEEVVEGVVWVGWSITFNWGFSSSMVVCGLFHQMVEYCLKSVCCSEGCGW